MFLRNNISRNPKYNANKGAYKRTLQTTTEIINDLDDERSINLMKHKNMVTSLDRDEVLSLMRSTRVIRQQWIATKIPSITEILEKYPKFLETEYFVSSLLFQNFY